MDSKMTTSFDRSPHQGVGNGLTQHWVRTVDAQGHEHLEARWLSPQLLAASVHHAA